MARSTLRKRLIRLAYAEPKYRASLLPLLRTGEYLPHMLQKQVDKAKSLDGVDPSIAKLLVRSGQKDGDRGDDVVSVSKSTWPAASLKPSQTSMVLAKSLGMALFMLATGKIGGDLGALVSSDGHILDGHHRWGATILAAGSKGTVGGYQASLPGKDLLKVLNIVSKGMFNVRGGKPGKGALSTFTPSNVRSMLTDFIENGIPGEFPWAPEKVRSTLEKAYGSVEEGIDQMAQNVKLMTLTAPSWAPDRKQMPVIDPNNVPKAVQVLNNGLVDWKAPYHTQDSQESGGRMRVRASGSRTAGLGTGTRYAGTRSFTASDRDALIRLASSLPKGSKARRTILSGLKIVGSVD